MHRHIFAFAAALTLLSKGDLYAQVPPCTGPLPDLVFGTHLRDEYKRTVASSDGNYLMLASVLGIDGNITASTYGGTDIAVLKVTPTGDLLWSVVLGTSTNDYPEAIMAMADGGCVVTFQPQSPTAETGPSRVVRLSGAGAELWVTFGSEGGPAFGALCLTGAGTIMVVNTSNFTPGATELDPNTGAVIGTYPFIEGDQLMATADGGFLAFTQVLESPSGSIVCPNWTGVPGLPFVSPYLVEIDAGLIKYDASGGIQWKRRFLSYGAETPEDVLELPDGYLVLVESETLFSGPSIGGDHLSPRPGATGRSDIWLIRTDLAGEIIWERTFGSSENERAGSLLAESGGDFIIAASSCGVGGDVTEPSRGGCDGWLVKVDDLGNKLWDKRWGGERFDELVDMFPSPTGYLLFGASSSPRSGEREAPLVDVLVSDWGTDLWVLNTHVGTAPTWYEDADLDGYGDVLTPLTACSQPSGYVANSWDCDPLVPNPTGTYVGARCSDGNLFTFPDRVGEDCTCQGSIPDFLFDNLVFNLLPDAFAGGMSMSIFLQGEPNAGLSFGPWPNAQPGVTITEQFQLPPGAYTMRVFDAQGDGIIGGGFTLTVNGKRVIQADGGFQQLSEAPLGFELPLGERSLTSATCDRLDLLPTSSIIASPEPLVSERYSRADATTGYQFWIFNPHGGYSRRIYQSHRNPGQGSPPGPDACAHLKLSNIVTSPVPQMVLLNVRVRPRVDGVYGPFGPACTIKVDPYAQVCPTTKLVDQPGNPNFSCGAQRSFGGSSKVVANTVSGANKYQFEFVEPINGYTRRITSANNTRQLNWTTQQPLCGTFTYQVRVRVSFDGGQNWCPWGAPCPVTIANYQAGCTPVVGVVLDQGQRSMEAFLREPGFRVYPTVTEQRVLWLQAPQAGDLQVDVVDLTGALVHSGRHAVPDDAGPVELTLPADIAPGIYLVRMVQGDVLHTERVVLH